MTRANGTKSNSGSKEAQQKIEKLRDSTLEKLLNGEKDLKDIFGLSNEAVDNLSKEEKLTLKKKLSSSLKERKDRIGGGTI